MIHQLRIYEIDKDLKAAFDKRFREHASRIMKSYEFIIVAMWYSEYAGKTEFVYILRWPDATTMRAQWEMTSGRISSVYRAKQQEKWYVQKCATRCSTP
jgi:hypothetical protein